MSKHINNPWNELNPYSEGQPIYGRNQFISKLTDAIYTNLQTIIYGKSGIGKTSLLQAGCFPELRKLQFFPIVIRPGIMESSDDYIATVIDVIKEKAEESIPEIKTSLHTKTVDDGIFTHNRLCQFLYSTQFVDDTDTPYIPVLIFDQLEEFLNNKKTFSKAVCFLKELYVLLDNTILIPSGYLEYSNYRLVFAIREDYLYCLEDIVDRYNLDELHYNRHRITALSDKQAQNVIEKTFRSSIESISSDDLNCITNIILPIAKGQSEYADIHTPILSLLGSLIYKQIVAGETIDIINANSINNELYIYYDEIMSDPKIPMEVRWFLEQKLITVDGRRDSMDYQSALLTNQINEEQIDYLVREKKILRIVEAGSGERRLEYSHDTICKALKPVIEMRDGFYNKGNDLYIGSFDIKEKQPEMVRYLSYAAELCHFDAKRLLSNLYEEKVKGTLDDLEFKSTISRRDRLVTLLNGKEWTSMQHKIKKANNKFDIYLSYSHNDSEMAEQLYQELQSIGCTVRMNINNLNSGDIFAETIDAIDSSKIVLFLASKSSFTSSYNKRELWFADRQKKTIIFLTIDEAIIPDSLASLIGQKELVDIRNDFQKNKLFRNLQRIASEGAGTDIATGIDLVKVLLDGLTIDMIRVEGGLFTMGATAQQGGENPDEREIHDVRLDSYYIAKVPVTQSLWKKVMGYNPSEHYGDDSPVNNVSWNDCVSFINCLNTLTGKEFRLPTEAEWEYAAKGGSKGRYNGYKYSGGNNLNNVAWSYENSGGKPHGVAQKSPNELGIHDMSGNVWEWCSDWYASYPDSQVTNPQGPADGNKKVCRGGSWNDRGKECRISRREARTPDTGNPYIGFRLAL